MQQHIIHLAFFLRLIPCVVDCAFKIAKQSGNGWRVVSPHFTSLLDNAIFPTLVLNQKGPRIATATTKRKKADKSKGKQQESSIGELLVIPFLSKFPMPYHGDKASSKIVHNICLSLNVLLKVVERGFAALAAITKTWEASSAGEALEHDDKKWESAQAVIARTFATLLYQAWAVSVQSIVSLCISHLPMDSADISTSPPPSCLDDASTLLGFILKSATKNNEIEELKIPELLALWSDLISDWHGWEEMEDLAVFDCIQEAVNLQRRCDSTNFLLKRISSRVSPGVDQSIIEGVSAFVTKGIMAYPSATWRACSCVHELLHVPSFSFQMQGVKQSIITSFTQAAFSHFKDLRNKPNGLWKPLLLVISSCYILCPEIVKQVLDQDDDNGFMIVASGLAHVSSKSFDSGISSVSEIKLAVITLEKFVERLVAFPLEDGNKVLQDCFVSLMEAFLHLKEVEEKEAEESDSEDIDDGYSDEEISDNEVNER
ncbi:hypothetical protein BHE74_00004230 [Ensete ventricosum]|nr:hypothetical protein GW17_00018408 [Ensete ventricosum]RWW86975.1 hypothetical protein BHE74_00004230 [Ensete ventricosum]